MIDKKRSWLQQFTDLAAGQREDMQRLHTLSGGRSDGFF